MRLNNLATDRQPETGSGRFVCARIGGVFLEDTLQFLGPYAGPGVAHLDAVSIARRGIARAAIGVFDVHGQIRTTPVPESGTRPDLDETVARREAAGVVPQVYKHLLDLNIVQKKRLRARRKARGTG